MRNKYKNKIISERNIKEKNSIDINLNDFKDVNIIKIRNKKNTTIINDKNIKNEKKVLLNNNLFNDSQIYKHAPIRKKLYQQSNDIFSPKRKENNVPKTTILTNKSSNNNINNILIKNNDQNDSKKNKDNKDDKDINDNNSKINTIHVKKKNFENSHKAEHNKRINIRKNNFNNNNNNSQLDNPSLHSNENLFNYTRKKIKYQGKIKSFMNKNKSINENQMYDIINRYTHIHEIKNTRSVEKKSNCNDLLGENSNYNKTEANSRILPNDFKLKRTYLLFPKKEENDTIISKTIDLDKKGNEKTNTDSTYNYYQNTESTLTKENINNDKYKDKNKDKNKEKDLTQIINNKEAKNKKRNYIYINRRIRNIANDMKSEVNNTINKTETLSKLSNKPNKIIEIEVENGNSIKSPSIPKENIDNKDISIYRNNIINRCLLTEKKREIYNKNQSCNKNEYILTHKSNYDFYRDKNKSDNNNNKNNMENDNNKNYQSLTFLVHKAHEMGQLSNSFGKFYIKGPVTERNIQTIQKKNNLKNNNNNYSEREEYINKKLKKKKEYSNIMLENKKNVKKNNHNSLSVGKQNINYLNNIINNNTFNTTVNFYKINQIPINLNKHRKEHKRANSNYSLNPKYLKIAFNEPEKKNNISCQKINNSNSYKNINYIVDTELKEEKDTKEYNMDLEILYILEYKIKNILNKINNYEMCYNECFEWINHYFNYNFYKQEINLFKLNHNKNNIIYYIKIELLCYFLCYDVSFNKNFNQEGILLKTIFNLLHINYLILLSFIINISENNNSNSYYSNSNEEMYLNKLKEIIHNELKLKLTAQDMNENSILSLISNNFKEINNYYKMIIDNLYSYYYSINDDDINKVINKFPNCLSLNIKSLNTKQKLNIISTFFFDSYRLSTNYTFEDLKKFFYTFIYKSKDSIYLLDYNNANILTNKSENTYNNSYFSSNNHTQPNLSIISNYFYEQNNTYNTNITNNNINQRDGYYLPPIKSYYKYTLVLDLDETLVFFQKENDLIYNSYNIYSNTNTKGTLIFRPGLMDFLLKMKPLYELVLFSFGTQEYVEQILSVIEKKEKIFEHVLYRHHATYEKGDYVKNLELLGRDMKKIIIVDDIPHTFKLQKSNGICIKPFYGDVIADRNTLKLLGKILEKIRFDAEENDGDIRISLKNQRNLIFTHITTDLEY